MVFRWYLDATWHGHCDGSSNAARCAIWWRVLGAYAERHWKYITAKWIYRVLLITAANSQFQVSPLLLILFFSFSFQIYPILGFISVFALFLKFKFVRVEKYDLRIHHILPLVTCPCCQHKSCERLVPSFLQTGPAHAVNFQLMYRQLWNNDSVKGTITVFIKKVLMPTISHRKKMKLYKIENEKKEESKKEKNWKLNKVSWGTCPWKPKFQPFHILLNFHSVVLSF